MTTSRTAITAISVAVLVAGCGSTPDSVAGPGSVPAITTPVTTTPVTSRAPASRGWIGGEPDWLASSAGAGAPTTYSAATAGTAAAAGEAAAVPLADTALPVEAQPAEQAGLRAGSVDDNADFAAFLSYLARIKDLGIATRAFDPTGRIVVTVTGTTGLPVAGAQVTITANGAGIATLRTTADGTARFLPALYDAGQVAEFTFTTGDSSATAAPGSSVALHASAPGGVSGLVALDVLFLLDATGSMGDEISRLKATIDSVAAQIDGFESQPDVRLAMTLYRDQGDTFVTSTFDFTGDIAAFRTALNAVVAEGGGDYPEALEDGLASALSAPTWRDPATTVQLVFLVGDAPPHVDRPTPVEYPAAVIDAIARGIKVFPIASSESDDQAEAVFRQIAAATGARFVFLSYGAQGAATGAATDINSTDYEELPLDALVVRLIAEELAALSGTHVAVPPVTVPPATNPVGQ
jgi:hypothetical protein